LTAAGSRADTRFTDLNTVPQAPNGLHRATSETHRRFTRRIDLREGWPGHLWQERFRSFLLDETHLLAAVR
jgi:putative transposase